MEWNNLIIDDRLNPQLSIDGMSVRIEDPYLKIEVILDEGTFKYEIRSGSGVVSFTMMQEIINRSSELTNSLMSLKEYSPLALRTKPEGQNDIIHALMGMTTEVGELTDIYKRVMFYGSTISINHVKEELGDLFWYINLLAYSLDISLEECLYLNIKKLKKRYPEGFNSDDAIKRVDQNGV